MKKINDGIVGRNHTSLFPYQGWPTITKDENGVKMHVNISNYGVMGERKTKWFVDDLQIYHRTFSYIVNTLINAGFTIEKMLEPLPSPELLEKYPEHYDLFHKPDFLIMRSKKR